MPERKPLDLIAVPRISPRASLQPRECPQATFTTTGVTKPAGESRRMRRDTCTPGRYVCIACGCVGEPRLSWEPQASGSFHLFGECPHCRASWAAFPQNSMFLRRAPRHPLAELYRGRCDGADL